MGRYSRDRLLELLGTYETKYGKLPTKMEFRREFHMCDSHFTKHFGGLLAAKTEYRHSRDRPEIKEQTASMTTLFEELKTNLSESELKTLVESTRKVNINTIPELPKPPTGKTKVLVTGDSHIGHSKFSEGWWYEMLTRAVGEGCEFMWHTGDILEGMSGRPGHVYELAHIGFEAQFDKAYKLFEECPFPVRAITGNHDLWYMGKGDLGVNVGQRLQEALPSKFIHLGDEEADELLGNIKVKLWHGRDGASYAYSYRCQKFVENLSDDEKPHILLSGHAHKGLFFNHRNINIIESGTTCAQTGFMRGKKMAAHTGYWIVEIVANEHGVSRIKPEWFPLY